MQHAWWYTKCKQRDACWLGNWCNSMHHSFEIHPKTRYGIKLPLFLVAYSAFVTYSYIIINNPVYHQVCYALVVLTVVIRSIYVGQRIPSAYSAYEKVWMTRLLWTAALCFGGAFAVWNVDNAFCTSLRGWRSVVGLPLGAISEVSSDQKKVISALMFFFIA